MCVGLYPRSVRWCVRLHKCVLVVSGVEQMRRMRMAWLYGILLNVCGAWHDVGSRYEWVSVGLLYICVSIRPFFNSVRVSKNGTLVLEETNVNLIVGWDELRWSLKDVRWVSPCGHMKVMSSMKRFHDCGRGLCREFSSSLFSSSPMNRFAYEGAVGVPMAVP